PQGGTDVEDGPFAQLRFLLKTVVEEEDLLVGQIRKLDVTNSVFAGDVANVVLVLSQRGGPHFVPLFDDPSIQERRQGDVLWLHWYAVRGVLLQLADLLKHFL